MPFNSKIDFNLVFSKRRALALLVASGVSGCAMLSPVERPSSVEVAANTPSQWRESVVDGVGTVPNLWWQSVDDPTLNFLVTAAMASSPSLDIVEAKLAAARASRSQIFAGALPSFSGTWQGSRAQQGVAETLQATTTGKLDASWELDLFGAVQNAKASAVARERAAGVAIEDARLSLSAEVANAYTAYQVCAAALALSEQDLASRERTLVLTSASVDAGLTAPYLKVRAQASVNEALVQLTNYKAQCHQAENNLVRLSGLTLDQVQEHLARQPAIKYLTKVVDLWALGLPTDVLLRRPDVRNAYHLLTAASADVGLAIADQRPRLSLSGGLVYSRQDAGGTLVSFGSWSFGPTLSVPLFDGGKKRSATQAAYARLQEAQAQYRLKVENGVNEVENGLSRYKASLTRLAAAETTAKQYQSYFDTMNLRYKEGASNLLELEDSRRTWLSAQQGLLSAQQEHLQAWVYLNRVTAAGTGYPFGD